MSRKAAYKQLLSIGTAMVLRFALFTGSLDRVPKLLSPQSDGQAAALAEKQNESTAAPMMKPIWLLASNRVRLAAGVSFRAALRRHTPNAPRDEIRHRLVNQPLGSCPVAYT